MSECGMCSKQMGKSGGCIEHMVLLSNGTVLESPRHNRKGSLGQIYKSCPDCGVSPEEIHHPFCDWARADDGHTQILSSVLEYWNQEDDPDPRERESNIVFPVLKMGEETVPIGIYSSHSVAKQVTNHIKQNSECEDADLFATRLSNEEDGDGENRINSREILSDLDNNIESTEDVDVFLVTHTEEMIEIISANKSFSNANEMKEEYINYPPFSEINITGHTIEHEVPEET